LYEEQASSREARLAEEPERQRQEIMRYGLMGPWTSEKFERQGGAMAHYGPHVAPPVPSCDVMQKRRPESYQDLGV